MEHYVTLISFVIHFSFDYVRMGISDDDKFLVCWGFLKIHVKVSVYAFELYGT